MSLLARLERKFGRYAIPNLTVILIVGQVFLYVANMLERGPGAANLLALIVFYPELVLAGEWWRVATFLFVPPAVNPLFAAIFWYLFYFFGTTLEATWGVFRYNVFLAIGYVASVVMAFVALSATGGGVPATNGFLYATIFLAFARLNPDFVLHLFFILPVKVKWLALIQWGIYGYTLLAGPTWLVRAMVVASVLNFLLFFGRDLWRDVKQGQRRRQYQSRTLRAPARIVHTCRVCGLNSNEAPQVQFRYCSKCAGEQCYCPEHLRNHEHVTHETPEVSGRRSEP